MSTTDITGDKMFQHRVEMYSELNFAPADAVRLAEAKRLVSNYSGGQLYLYEVAVYWGHVSDMLDNGATHDQVLRIIL